MDFFGGDLLETLSHASGSTSASRRSRDASRADATTRSRGDTIRSAGGSSVGGGGLGAVLSSYNSQMQQQQQQQQYHHAQQQQQQQQHHPHHHLGSSVSSHNNNAMSSAASIGAQSYASAQSGRSSNNPVEDAYRRLGQRLSLQAHGDDASSVSSRGSKSTMTNSIKLGTRKKSCFSIYGKHYFSTYNNNNTNNNSTRSTKVPKIRYSDHGDHHLQQEDDSAATANTNASNQILLKNITVYGKASFERWEQQKRQQLLQQQQQQQQEQQQQTTTGNTNLSPQRFAFAQMALQSGQGSQESKSDRRIDRTIEEGEEFDEKLPSSSAAAPVSASTTSSSDYFVSNLSSVLSGPSSSLPTGTGRHNNHHHQNRPKGLLSAVLECNSDASQSVDNRSVSTKNSFSTRGSAGMASVHTYGTARSSNTNKDYVQQQQKQVQQQQQQQQQQDQQGIRNIDNSNSKIAATTNTTAAPAGMPRTSAAAATGANGDSSGEVHRCLTQPSEPVANDGLDNIEGNLIVFEKDILSIPASKVHTTADTAAGTKNNNSKNPATSPSPTTMQSPSTQSIDSNKMCGFQIQSLLGQGTFAQVFECIQLETGKRVAVKIVKNKPAYTKQAAVEIDVFQALASNNNNNNNSGTNSNKNIASTTNINVNNIISSNGNNNNIAGGIGASLSNPTGSSNDNSNNINNSSKKHMVQLVSYFMYKSHLCLVFEKLGLNLYEVLKRRQFRGLPLSTVQALVRQALEGIKVLAQKTIVHCDLKPENILLDTEEEENQQDDDTDNKSNTKYNNSGNPTERASSTASSVASAMVIENTNDSNKGGTQQSTSLIPALPASPRIKLIDFGSACFEGYSAHTYIQSRFYRSPEVLIGLPYDSAIDMWSLGCVAAELYLGLPILPGVHEHDQCGRICEMIADLPEWMLEQGTKSQKYFCKESPSQQSGTPSPMPNGDGVTSGRTKVWRIKTQPEYIQSLTPNEIRKKGGLAKLEKQPANRYFKRKKLSDIIFLHGQNSATTTEEKELLELFVHYLYGLLDPDPWKRWTAHQAVQHPFMTGVPPKRRRKNAEINMDENQANRHFDIYWVPPWDPGICRRKLVNVQKIREKQQVQRRSAGVNSRQPEIIAASPDKYRLQANNRRIIDSSRSQQLQRQQLELHYQQQQQQHIVTTEGSYLTYGGTGSPTPQLQPSDNLFSGAGISAQQQLDARTLGAAMIRAGSMPKHNLPLAQSAQAFLNDTTLIQDHVMRGSSFNNPLMFSGPSSFTGVGIENIRRTAGIEEDFSYALQRPGVVPSAGNADAAQQLQLQLQLQQRQQDGQEEQDLQQQRQQQLYAAAGMEMPASSRSFSSHMAPPMGVNSGSVGSTASIGSYPTSAHNAGLGGHIDPGSSILQHQLMQQQQQQQLLQQQQQQLLQQHHQNIGINDTGINDALQDQLLRNANDYPSRAAYTSAASLQEQHQQQLAALHQLQQQQLVMLQQQQLIALQQRQQKQQHHHPHQHQHQQQQQHQQQHQHQHQHQHQQHQQYLSPYGTTGSGYYYVSSADGTPMIMPTGASVSEAGAAAMGDQGNASNSLLYGANMAPPAQVHQHLQHQQQQQQQQQQYPRDGSSYDDEMNHSIR